MGLFHYRRPTIHHWEVKDKENTLAAVIVVLLASWSVVPETVPHTTPWRQNDRAQPLSPDMPRRVFPAMGPHSIFSWVLALLLLHNSLPNSH